MPQTTAVRVPRAPRLRYRRTGTRTQGHTTAVKLPPDVAARAKAVAACQGQRLSHVLSDLCEQWLAKAEAAR
jgi:hypothetical protein